MVVQSQFIEMFRTAPKEHVHLKDIATYSIGLTYKPENVKPSGIPVLRSGNIQEESLDFGDLVRVDSSIPDTLLLQDGDILMCSRNGSAHLVGKVARIRQLPEPMTYGAFMTVIRSEYMDYLFLFFQSDGFRQQISYGKSSTMNQITQKMLDQITIDLPLRTEIEKLSPLLEQADKSKFDGLKSQFIEMFGTPSSSIFPIKKLSEVCTFKSGTTFSPDKELSCGDYMYAKVADMNIDGNDTYITHTSKYVDSNVAKNTWLPKGTVVFPKRGAAIHTNKKRILIEDTCVDLNTIGVIPGSMIESLYLFWFFRCLNLSDICEDSGIPQINNKNLVPVDFVVPPISVQLQFADVAKQADKSKYLS